MGCCSIKLCFFVVLSVLGIASLLLGVLSLFFMSKLVDRMVREQTYLGTTSNGSDNIVLKMFRDPPYDIKLQIWTYSTQNLDGVMERGEKPVLEEKGPYTFIVLMHKNNVSFGENNTRLFFRNERRYFFDASRSCANCSLADRVTVPNILFQKIVDIASAQPFLIRKAIEIAIRNKEKVFLNVSVSEFLFEGYEDALIKSVCGIVPSVCAAADIPKRIGLFYGQNGTDDGLYEVDTGQRNVDLLDKVYSWNANKGKLTNKFWYGDSARLINGTDAELYKPSLYSGENLQIFVGQLCRSFELEKQTATFSSGIPVFRYSQPATFLDVQNQRSGGFCNPNAADYFHNESIQEIGCAPRGLIDMASCLPGQPRIFWSNAHFLNAPNELSFEGMRAPSTIEDASYFDIEPITGVVIGVQQKSQLNLGMLRGKLSVTQKMRDLIMPLIWINESAVIDSNTRQQLEVPVRVVAYSNIAGWILLLCAALCLSLLVVLVVARRFASRQEPEEAPLVTAASSSSQRGTTNNTPSQQQQ